MRWGEQRASTAQTMFRQALLLEGLQKRLDAAVGVLDVETHRRSRSAVVPVSDRSHDSFVFLVRTVVPDLRVRKIDERSVEHDAEPLDLSEIEAISGGAGDGEVEVRVVLHEAHVSRRLRRAAAGALDTSD